MFIEASAFAGTNLFPLHTWFSLKNKATKTENSINDMLLADMEKIKEETKQIQEGKS